MFFKNITDITVVGIIARSIFYTALVVIFTYGLKSTPKSNVTEITNTTVESKIDNSYQDILDLATSNGFNPSKRVVDAILYASDRYGVNSIEMTAIAIVETGLGKYTRNSKNQNGTIDRGLFQINTVNNSKCIEYNLESPEGSSLCAAKLLSEIKIKYKDYLGVYHSKTPAKKKVYIQKIAKVLENK